MQEQEKDNLRRIEALEKIMDDKVATSVDGKIQDRIARLESSLSDRMDERVQKKVCGVTSGVPRSYRFSSALSLPLYSCPS